MHLAHTRDLDPKALHKAACRVKPETRHFIAIDCRLIEFSGRGGVAERVPYQLGSQSISPQCGGFVIQLVWPNAPLILLPGADILLLFLINPIGPEATAELQPYFTSDGTVADLSKPSVDWFNAILGAEDVELFERVQREPTAVGAPEPATDGRLQRVRSLEQTDPASFQHIQSGGHPVQLMSSRSAVH